MNTESRKRPLIAIGITLVIILIIGFGLALNPGKTQIDLSENGSDILFSASRRWVIRNGDCVTLRWQVGGIQTVTIDRQGRVGEDEAPLCVDNGYRTTRMIVRHLDGSESEYSLTVSTMANAPEIWILFIAGLTLILSGIYIFITPLLAPLEGVIKPILRWSRILLLNFVIALFITEIGLRFYVLNYGSEQDRGRYVYTTEQLQERTQLQGMPFLNFTLTPAEANNLGYRNNEDTILPKPDGTYRIVALGGSTTYGLGLTANESYPAQLQQILRESYGYDRVEVLNAGVVSYDTWNSLVNLAFRVLEVEPDLVIIHHGINDVRARLSNPECYRGENTHRGIYTGAGVVHLQDQFLIPGTLYRYIGINMGWMEDPIAVGSNVEHLIQCDPTKIDRVDLMGINEPVYFERNLISMIGIADAHDVDVMLSTLAFSDEMPENVGPEWWRLAIAQHNTVIRDVAESQDTFFFDLEASTLSENPDYWSGDFTHQSYQGAHAQAELYADYLTDEGIISSGDN